MAYWTISSFNRDIMRAKKQFGQNWLVDNSVIADMLLINSIQPGDLIVEIGPGKGALTKALLEHQARVIAVEKDRDLIPLLREEFESDDNLELINEDIRDLDIKKLTNESQYRVIANIPYYITGLLIRKFLSDSHQPISVTFLTQREVTDRIVATDNKESVLSLSVKAYGKPIKVRNVKAGAFRPIPSVGSAVLHINSVSRRFFIENNLDEDLFFATIKKAFNQKRKTLQSSINLLNHHHSSTRPEDLELEDWIEVTLATNLKS